MIVYQDKKCFISLELCIPNNNNNNNNNDNNNDNNVTNLEKLFIVFDTTDMKSSVNKPKETAAILTKASIP